MWGDDLSGLEKLAQDEANGRKYISKNGGKTLIQDMLDELLFSIKKNI